MILGFYLSMPSVASWNGKWSGEGKLYAKCKAFVGKQRIKRAKEILAKGYFYHAWDDGWAAGVSVKEIDSKEATQIRSKSKGFCGYDWMIDNIIDNLSTRKPEEKADVSTTKEA